MSWRIGDLVSDSPVGSGVLTGITERGYPQVNHVAVTWLERNDGARFDPHNRKGGSRLAATLPQAPHKDQG
jgi:hypothetical protein